MKGIILAGGSGTRLYPVTKAISKQILPIYDKPMIYYPLSTLMLADIREILIISTPQDIHLYQDLLGDGSDSRGFSEMLKKAVDNEIGATIFGYYVSNPQDFGVVEFDKDGKVMSLEEKPQNPKSNYAIPGLYFYDNDVVDIAKNVKPSKRGELEITSVNEEYMKRGKLKVELFGRGMAWLDTGTHDGLLEAANFVHTLQKRTGLYVSCIEEIAYRKGYIDKSKLDLMLNALPFSAYKTYLEKNFQ